MSWHVKVEHMAHSRDVEPAGGHIRGHQQPDRPVPEPVERAHPLGLLQIAVDRRRVVPVLVEAFGHDIHIRLAVAEDDRVRAGLAFAVDKRTQEITLFLGRPVPARGTEHDHRLGDRLGGGCLAGHFDLRGVRQEGVGDPLDLGRHGGRKEQCLAREWHEAENAFDVGDEPHVEHPVGLINHHDLDAGQQQFATLEMVKQAARCRDQNINAPVDQRVLLLEADATD